MKKKGQIELSFGMIFSIILIIIFLSFAFFVIKKFLDMKDALEAGRFASQLQDDVDKMWKSSQGSQEQEYIISSKIEKVCFADFDSNNAGNDSELYRKLKQVYYGNENLFFYPVGSGNGIDAIRIEYINIEKITEENNPYCIENNGKVKLTINKNFDEVLVNIE